MQEKENYIERAISILAQGKTKTYGLMRDSEGTLFLIGRGLHHKIIKLYLQYDNSFYDEDSFSNPIIFGDKDNDKPAWFTCMDQEQNYISSIFEREQHTLCLIAIMQPNKAPYYDPTIKKEKKDIPICMKAIFKGSDCAIAVVQEKDIANLWMLEGEQQKNTLVTNMKKETDYAWATNFGIN